jgi:hypothetical protein
MLDFPARTIQIQPAPPNAGTKHLESYDRVLDSASFGSVRMLELGRMRLPRPGK